MHCSERDSRMCMTDIRQYPSNMKKSEASTEVRSALSAERCRMARASSQPTEGIAAGVRLPGPRTSAVLSCRFIGLSVHTSDINDIQGEPL